MKKITIILGFVLICLVVGTILVIAQDTATIDLSDSTIANLKTLGVKNVSISKAYQVGSEYRIDVILVTDKAPFKVHTIHISQSVGAFSQTLKFNAINNNLNQLYGGTNVTIIDTASVYTIPK